MAVAVSCQYEGCDAPFTLSDLPVRCDQCRKDFCFDHREPEQHDCLSLPAIPIERVKTSRASPVVPLKRSSVTVVDIQPEVEVVSLPDQPVFYASPSSGFQLNDDAARIGLILVIGVFIVLTRYLLF